MASTEENRHPWRELLFTTPGGVEAYISGVILFDETIRQRVEPGDGRSQRTCSRSKGIIPGVKVDKGARPLSASSRGETATEGLDGLRAPTWREYNEGSVPRFAKWRATYSIGPGRPSDNCVRANTHALARYAALCQEAGLVPVVEPEVLMTGTHSLSQCETVTSLVLLQVVTALQDSGVDFEAIVLKPNMALPGLDSGERATPGQVAEASAATLNSMPAALAGVAFLSGGQGPAQATENLAALQRMPSLWPLTFSFGRALVDPALAAWRGDQAAAGAGQVALLRRVAMNSAALAGRYTPELELEPA